MHDLDHLFVFCQRGAPERRALLDAGLVVGRERRHAGQGTANACFGFADGYLELLWLEDDVEARDPLVKPLGLHERARWRDSAASPFGVAVRPRSRGGLPPLATWDYRPKFLPEGMTLAMGCNSGVLGEPILFQLDRPFEPLPGSHALSSRRIAAVTVTTPQLAPMSLLRDVRIERLVFADGPEHLMEITLDGEVTRTIDLRPALPLLLRC